MKRYFLALIALGTVAGTLAPLQLKAQEPILIAQRSLDCNAVESLGNLLLPVVSSEINNRVAGTSHVINNRKTLKINRVNNIAFKGCKVSLDLDVVLQRKIRRDAAGTIKMSGDISSFDLGKREICYRNAGISSVSLSRTLGIGESFYKWVGNKALPNSDCLKG